jgi:predicted ATP-grasp superfamily ATP-dependent carboligase
MRVLVTDAENKNALAAVRSLARSGAAVVAGSTRRLARSFWSRHRESTLRYPPPEREDEFVDAVLAAVRERSIDVVLPVGDAANRTCSRQLERLSPHVAVPVADWRAMEIASSKRLTFPYAAEVGIDAPRTYADPTAVDRFPVVVKRSTVAGGVRYVNDAAELAAADTSDAVVQEWIPGEGYGFFALFEHGRERAVFMHRRLREYPVTGGASTAAESVDDPELRRLGLELLRALGWHGVAMVEFKRDSRDGRFRLMEINPKLWGSLDLSIAAGVDFPTLAAEMALGRLDGAAPGYRTGVRFRWVFDDLMHVAARPGSLRAFLRDFRDPRVHQDVWLSDPGPALFDAARTGLQLVSRTARGTLRRPHGEPRGGAAALRP